MLLEGIVASFFIFCPTAEASPFSTSCCVADVLRVTVCSEVCWVSHFDCLMESNGDSTSGSMANNIEQTITCAYTALRLSRFQKSRSITGAPKMILSAGTATIRLIILVVASET